MVLELGLIGDHAFESPLCNLYICLSIYMFRSPKRTICMYLFFSPTSLYISLYVKKFKLLEKLIIRVSILISQSYGIVS